MVTISKWLLEKDDSPVKFNILVVKESRAGEQRVALIPKDVAQLVAAGHKVYVEQDAGLAAGFPDQEYSKSGAVIRRLDDSHSVDSYRALLQDINFIVRAKRPERDREQLEAQAMVADSRMIGALDPRERGSSHIAEYQRAGIQAYSIDQLLLPANHPMNILAEMSQIAGRLALSDAVNKHANDVQLVVIIGFGSVGRAAWEEANERQLQSTVVVRRAEQTAAIEKQGGQAFILDNQADIETQRDALLPILQQADVIVTSARSFGQQAPLLITAPMLQEMRSGCVIVDMALSEGGNVEGSEHDNTLTLGNNVLVTNASGYPKAVPHEASIAWSRASLHVVEALANADPIMDGCLIS